jgi:glycosyltransferase involved in cell wall biosynthesis
MKGRVLFLNDLGFQYGAGIAQARQIQAFLDLEWEVGSMAWEPGGISLGLVLSRPINEEFWLGLQSMRRLDDSARNPSELISDIVLEAARFDPDVIIVGNLHGARWPLELLTGLRRLRSRIITYLHDLYYITGRCAYPGSCTLYLSGCDASCATADNYPPLPREQIYPQWSLRRSIFSRDGGIEVVANSDWTASVYQRAIPAGTPCNTVYLGADENVFQPGDKNAARVFLGIPNDKPVILCAAVNFDDPRKGGAALLRIIDVLKDEVTFVAFGHNTSRIPHLIGLGYSTDAHRLACFYQAADVYLATASEEAFGQTLFEAQLCGRPVVVFQTGGVIEIIRNEITGKLVPLGDSEAAVTAIRVYIHDENLLYTAGAWARESACRRFSLRAQANGWLSYLSNQSPTWVGHAPPQLQYTLATRHDQSHQPSWIGPASFLSSEHEGIYEQTAQLPGWQTPGDSWKLYEMGHHSGDIILEIGTFGGRSAVVELRGALSNPNRTKPPQYYGVDIAADAIARTRQIIADQGLVDYCHLYKGSLKEFFSHWQIEPTMVFLDGDHTYEGITADMSLLSRSLKPGVPVLVHDYLNDENETGALGVRRATNEWVESGRVKFMGSFGCSALVVVTSLPAKAE